MKTPTVSPKRVSSAYVEFDNVLGTKKKVSEFYSTILHFSEVNMKKTGNLYAILSADYFAQKFKTSRATAYNYLKELIQKGFLEITDCQKNELILMNGKILNLRLTPKILPERIKKLSKIWTESSKIWTESSKIWTSDAPEAAENKASPAPLIDIHRNTYIKKKILKEKKIADAHLVADAPSECENLKTELTTTPEKKSPNPKSKKPDPLIDDQFNQFWAIFPKRTGGNPKTLAKNAFTRSLTAKNASRYGDIPDVDFERLLALAKAFSEKTQRDIEKIDDPRKREDAKRFIPMAATWLNQARWQDVDVESIEAESIPSNSAPPITKVQNMIESLQEPEKAKLLRLKIKEKVGHEVYLSWFHQATIEIEQQAMCLKAPNAFVEQYWETNFPWLRNFQDVHV